MALNIKRIVIVSHQGVSVCEVGSEGVDHIDDNSLEYDNHICNQYDAYDNKGNLLRQIIDCPVDITYFK